MVLKILSLILLILLVRAAFSVFGLVNQIRKTADQLRSQMNGGFGSSQQSRQSDGNTVYDQQSSARQQQKIIPTEEGEYVDFEDVKS